MNSQWNGFECKSFEFDGKNAVIVFPNVPRADGKWVYKTEYFDAFPYFEIEMLKSGYYLAHIENEHRWNFPEGTKRQAEFVKYIHDEYGLCEKCLPVGMSCGGMQAVYLAGMYPELVAALYLDAPVMNLLSCPCGIGIGSGELYKEYETKTGKTVAALVNYRQHPVDYIPILIKNQIPIFLVAGDSDKTVPFSENGKVLFDAYKHENADITCYIKKNFGHSPHSFENPKLLIDFAKRVYN